MIEALKDKFHVISVVSNPVRFESRPRLYRDFCRRMEAANVSHYKVELVYGKRAHYLTSSNDPKALQLRTNDELWHKENMINLAIQRLPDDWRYVAWVDADLSFLNRKWVDETIHALQTHKIVQLFENCIDLGPQGQVLQTHTSFGSMVATGKPVNHRYSKNYTFPHPGFAWAARREVLDASPLISRAILGSADHHICYCLLGRGSETIAGGMTQSYIKMVNEYQDLVYPVVRGDVGYVRGTIVHFWHGKKKNRGYEDRWQILKRNKYDPNVDVTLDSQGLLRLTGNKPALRDDLRRYFRSRMEDGIDLE